MSALVAFRHLVRGGILGLMALAGCSKHASVFVSRQDHFEIPMESATKLEATTRNGTVTALGAADHGGKVIVDAAVRGGGVSRGDAQAALEAIVVTVERKGGVIEASWTWKTEKAPAWGADVDFDIKVPPELGLKLVTHNGVVSVRGSTGDCILETHNGEITAQSTGARLDAATHNGKLDIATSASELALETYNGEIIARLDTVGDIGGSILSRNGGILVMMAPTVATALDCSTTNGRVHCDHNLEQALAKQSGLKGVLRGGKKTLRIETINGSIKVQ